MQSLRIIKTEMERTAPAREVSALHVVIAERDACIAEGDARLAERDACIAKHEERSARLVEQIAQLLRQRSVSMILRHLEA